MFLFFISWNWFSSKVFNEDNHILIYMTLNWILFNKFVYKFLDKTRQFLITNGIKSNQKIFCHTICYLSQLVLEITCLRQQFREIAQVHFWKFSNCPSKRRAISKILKIYTKNCLNQTCDYLLIIPNQQTLCIETNISKWTTQQ